MTQDTITIFGAESVGKTTVSRELARRLGANWRCEFARPYLESTGGAVTKSSMKAIWRGQRELQKTAKRTNYHLVIQDTDLFSTLGYWELPHVSPHLGLCPDGLKKDAVILQSDLYIVLRSNIPFERDALRFGGAKRESSDEYWIDICKRYELPHVIVEASNPEKRLEEAVNAIRSIQERSRACVG